MFLHKFMWQRISGNRPLPAAIRNVRYWVLLGQALLLLFMAAGCSKPPTTNKIVALDLRQMDHLLNNPSYTGFVAFMASWCPPCKEELPILSDLHSEFTQHGIQIAAVSVDAGGPGDAQPLVDRLGIQFPVYWVGTQAVEKYQLAGVPTMMVIQNGKLIEKIPGARSRKDLKKRLLALVPNR